MLAACAGTNTAQPPAAPVALEDTEVVAVSQPGFRLPVNAVLAWSGNVKIYTDDTMPQAETLAREVRQGLEAALAKRGLALVAGDAGFLVYATVIIGDAGDADGEALMGVLQQRTAGAAPGAATLGMALRRPGSERNLWQAVIRFEPGDPGQPQQLLSRLLVAADILLERLPTP